MKMTTDSDDGAIDGESREALVLPPRDHTVAHESGHAILLLSCASTAIELDFVSVKPDQNSAGRCGLNMTLDKSKGDWPDWACPLLDQAAEIEMIFMSFGGRLAETLLFGEEPGVGWANDERLIVVRLAGVCGGDAEIVRNFANAEDGQSGNSAQRRAAFAQGVGKECRERVVRAFETLEQEANKRLVASREALHLMKERFSSTDDVAGEDVAELLGTCDWCGELGAPSLR